jgi:hypothetical protein
MKKIVNVTGCLLTLGSWGCVWDWIGTSPPCSFATLLLFPHPINKEAIKENKTEINDILRTI